MTDDPRKRPAASRKVRPDDSGTILIVDDEVFIRNALQLYFETMGFGVRAAENGEMALELFADPGSVDLVILDLVMPGMSGIELLRTLKEKDPAVEVIITTGCGSMGTAIEALRLGAFDYITKPIVNFDEEILSVVRHALENRRRKAPGRPEPAGPANPSGREMGEALERFIELASTANQLRPTEPILEKVEGILCLNFDVRAGIALVRGQSGQFSPVYSWGFSGPISLTSDHLPADETGNALREGALAFFPTSAFAQGFLGVPPEDLEGCPKVACLPLVVQGSLWGCLVLFFAHDLPPKLAVSSERHPFQVLVPILSAVFSGALKASRPA